MPPRSWEEMRTSIADRLLRQTGHDVPWWNEQIAAVPGLDDDVSLRAWLASRAVTGYQQMLLVYERFGYPDYLLATADDLTEAQYADRPALRPAGGRGRAGRRGPVAARPRLSRQSLRHGASHGSAWTGHQDWGYIWVH